MSVVKAKALVKTLRWYHVGFAFLWATTFAGLSYPETAPQGYVQAFKLCNQMFVIVSVIGMAVVAQVRKSERLHPRFASVPGLLLGLGVLLFYGSFYFGVPSLPLVLISGALVGSASGLFFVLWQSFFTSEGATRTALYIPLSAVFSAVLCFIVRALPFAGVVVCVVVVLPLLASLSLYKAMGEVEPRETDAMASARVRSGIRDLWKPVFCVCAIGFVWKLVSHLFEGSDASTLNVVLIGFSAAALIIALVELFTEKGFEVLRSYQVLFPLVTGAFLLPAIFGTQFAPVLSGMLMFGFEIVNLLLIITCAIYANERSLPSTPVYALCLCPTFIAMLTGDALGAQLTTAFAYDLSFVVGILFLCVYVLSCTMFLVSWTKHRRHAEVSQGGASQRLTSKDSTVEGEGVSSQTIEEAGVSPQAIEEALAASLSARLDALDLVDPLSQREREVTLLLVRGYSVAAISRELFISENTVRGHTKNIYRKLDVHAKQQLIDLLGS